MRVQRILWLAALALGLSQAVPAVAETKIEVPADSRWQHARSQLILPTNIGDLKRQSITDYTQSELNVAAQYASTNSEVTLYLFRPHWSDVGAWFDRGEAVLLSNKATLSPVAELSPARGVARPKGTVESGLRRNYVYGKGRYKSSSLMIVPVGQWLLKIRYSSEEADPAITDTVMDKVLRSIKFPDATPEVQPVQTIAPCAESFKWKKTKIVREDMMSAMVNGGMFPEIMESKSSAAPAAGDVCRVGTSSAEYTLYRQNSDKTKFWMLVMDAGATAQIMETIPFNGGKQYWSVVSMDGKHDLLPAFKGLPTPDQWFSVILSGVSRATMIIDPDSPEGTKPETSINIITN